MRSSDLVDALLAIYLFTSVELFKHFQNKIKLAVKKDCTKRQFVLFVGVGRPQRIIEAE